MVGTPVQQQVVSVLSECWPDMTTNYVRLPKLGTAQYSNLLVFRVQYC